MNQDEDTLEEFKALGIFARTYDKPPTKGPICPLCELHIPSFKNVLKETGGETYYNNLVNEGKLSEAITFLSIGIGIPELWVKIWGFHLDRVPIETTHCPYCKKLLRMGGAKQCPNCYKSWHHLNDDQLKELWNKKKE